MKSQHHRREFLESLGIGAAGLITAGYTATARGYAANETLTSAASAPAAAAGS